MSDFAPLGHFGEERGASAMKTRMVIGLVLALAVAGCGPDTMYMVGNQESVTRAEAEARPPLERWSVLKELSRTATIEVSCHPDGTHLSDDAAIVEVVSLLQAARYIRVGDFPVKGPQLKVYFRRTDGSFIMAARVYPAEGVLVSPEGPMIQADARVVERLLEDGTCQAMS